MLRMNGALQRLWLAPTARPGHGYWLAIAFLLAVVVFSPAASRADTPLVSGDSLTGAACTGCTAGVTRSVEGGSLTPDGWSQDVVDSRIMYDLGRGVACARITFEATGWDPNQNMQGVADVDNYHDVFGIFEGSHGDPSMAVNAGETHIDIQVVAWPDRVCPADNNVGHHCRNIKLNGYAVSLSWNGGGCPECRQSGTEWCQPCGAGVWTETDVDWSVGAHYLFEIDWNYEGSSLTVSEIGPSPVIRETSAGWLDSNPMRYFFLGGDRKRAGKDITGPVYTNVQIWEVSPCANPCEGHCSNGVQDCVENDIDNGGKCAPDAGADAGTPDAGVDASTQDTGVADTGVPDAGHDTGHDTGVTDTGVTDTGVQDAGHDTGVIDTGTPDTGTPDARTTDTGTATDAGNGRAPSEETVGCSCATLAF